MTEFLGLKGLSKSYPDGKGQELSILKDIDYNFEEGQSHSVVGRSGSGKSTLLHLLGGLDHPSEGEVCFEGKNLFDQSEPELANWRAQNLGFVFQAHHLLPDFTALENAQIPGLIQGKSQAEARQRASELLARLGLEHRLNHKPGELSGGEQQRVAIARALAGDPRLILADEPTGNLDPDTGKSVADLLMELCEDQNKTLILVTHNPDLATKTRHRLRLQAGALEEEG